MKFRLTMLAALAVLCLAGCDQKKPAQAAKVDPQKVAAQKVAAKPDPDGPPLKDGLYVLNNGCEGEQCTFGFHFWRAKAPVALRERPDAASKIVTTIPAGESANPLTNEVHLVPVRGVVTKVTDAEGVKTGDVLWILDSQGEGTYNFWRRGEILALSFEGFEAKWDRDLEAAPKPVDWAHLQRQNGQSGWVAGEENFACIYDPRYNEDKNCVEAPPRPERYVGPTSTYESAGGREWAEKIKGAEDSIFQEAGRDGDYLYLRSDARAEDLKLPLKGGKSYYKDKKNPDWVEMMAIKPPPAIKWPPVAKK